MYVLLGKIIDSMSFKHSHNMCNNWGATHFTEDPIVMRRVVFYTYVANIASVLFGSNIASALLKGNVSFRICDQAWDLWRFNLQLLEVGVLLQHGPSQDYC